MAAHRLPGVGIGRDVDHRSARRHLRQGARAAVDADRARGGTALAAVSQSLGMLIVARVIQGVAGGIFPLAFSITRDEFPPEKVPGSIGLMSSILGVGAGFGLVVGALIVEHLGWHWLFWMPLIVTLVAACVHVALHPGVAGSLAGARELARGGADERSASRWVLIAIAQTTVWGWGGPKTLGLIGGRRAGLRGVGIGRGPQPRAVGRHGDDADPRGLDDQPGGVPARCRDVRVVHHLPRVRAAAEEHRLRVRRVDGRLEPLSAARGVDDGLLGSVAGPVARRFGSKTRAGRRRRDRRGRVWLRRDRARPADRHVDHTTLLGAGIGLAFAALGNLIVQAVPPTQTGVATGMNTVMRTLGGALGGQISATFIADHTIGGLPALAGFTRTFIMAALFLAGCAVAGVLIPAAQEAGRAPGLAARDELGRSHCAGRIALVALRRSHCAGHTCRSLGLRPCPTSTDTPAPKSRSTSNGTVSRDSSRPPLLLLHGGGSTIESNWGRLVPALESSRRMLAGRTARTWAYRIGYGARVDPRARRTAWPRC